MLPLALDGSNTVADFKVSGLCPAEKDTIVDVEVRNACAPSSFSFSSGAPRLVVEYAATAKMAKHGDAAASIHCSFVPSIVERFGAYEAQALAFVHKLVSRISSDVFTSVNWAACRTPLSYSTIVLLQRLSGLVVFVRSLL